MGNYFKISLHLLNVFKIDNVEASFNSIKMCNEDTSEEIIFQDRLYFFKKENPDILNLFIKNDSPNINERIDCLLDEEWIIENINLTITEYNVNLNYDIVGMEQEFIEEKTFLNDFLDKKYMNSTVSILGPKPPQLYGYHLNAPEYKNLSLRLELELEKLIQQGKTIFITNGYIGGETLAFDSVERLKQKYPHIKNILALPFLNLSDAWIDSSKNKLEQMKVFADEVIEIDKLSYYEYGTPEIYVKEKFARKNEFDVDFSSTIVIIDDGVGTFNSIKKRATYMKKELIEVMK